MKSKQVILCFAVLLISASSFFLPRFVMERQEQSLIGKIIVANETDYQSQTLWAKDGAKLRPITDIVNIAKIITLGEETPVNSIPINEPNAEAVIKGVQQEILELQELAILAEAEYTPIDMPTPIMYTMSQSNKVLLWHYEMQNEYGEILNLTYNTTIHKIISFEAFGTPPYVDSNMFFGFIRYIVGDSLFSTMYRAGEPPYTLTLRNGMVFSYTVDDSKYAIKYTYTENPENKDSDNNFSLWQEEVAW